MVYFGLLDNYLAFFCFDLGRYIVRYFANPFSTIQTHREHVRDATVSLLVLARYLIYILFT